MAAFLAALVLGASLNASLGVMRADDQFAELMPAGTRLPAIVEEEFVPADPSQSTFQITLVQEGKLGLETVAELIVPNLPRGPDKRIAISFRVDRSKALWVVAKVRGFKPRRYGPFAVN